MKVRTLAAGITALGLVLTCSACSASPSRDEVVERFAIELAGTMPGDPDKDDPAIRRLAEGLSEDSDKYCNDASFWRTASAQWDQATQYVWAASCGVLYDIEPNLDEAYRRTIVEYVTANID